MAMAGSVALVKVPAVLDLMMDVLLKLLSALSGDIVNVLLTNLEILNVDLALMMSQKIVKLQKMMDWGLEIQHQRTKVEILKVMVVKSVVKDKVLAVPDLMMDVHLKLLSALSLAIVNVLNISLADLNVDLALMTLML